MAFSAAHHNTEFWVGLAIAIGDFHHIILSTNAAAVKAVGRGDKTTRRVRVRVLALLENPRLRSRNESVQEKKTSTRSST